MKWQILICMSTCYRIFYRKQLKNLGPSLGQGNLAHSKAVKLLDDVFWKLSLTRLHETHLKTCLGNYRHKNKLIFTSVQNAHTNPGIVLPLNFMYYALIWWFNVISGTRAVRLD